ncbi:SH3 domain-containing protein [Tumebacillus permanentifrigoris]|uniref:N-acetylmuramoyl-L-alanine amidase n=1 Tax=Tumebacillus permanentifrigoris TaxID=378543 RepID=A0A316D7K3_9BACL|nr:SH3 domain-containing protein [Tumebacillus permanentifrigoris]PWK09058.1 N-acetylmuramoyl-L-alanine amidase [Tumebacillus permanentifrigoris]
MNRKSILVALVICFSLLFSVVAVAADNGRYVKVIAYDVNIRAGASTEDPVVGHADYGDQLTVLTAENGWYHVQVENGKTGWIHASLVKEGGRFATSNPTISVAEATVASLNVRGGASTSFEVVTTIQPGTPYPVLQQSADWVQIRLPDERVGWVAKSYVTLNEAKAKRNAQAEQERATVLIDSLNVRADPSQSAPILGTLKQGDLVQVTQEDSAWMQIDWQGRKAYVKAEYLKLPGKPLPSTETVPGPKTSDIGNPTLTLQDTTNIRSGPGTNFALLETGAAGSTYPVTGKSGKWLEINLANGQRAWVAGWLPQVNGDITHLPERGQSLDGVLHGKTIVLDAGHGGYDVGAIGRSTGVYEKDLTLPLTRLLANKLTATGARVVLTRSDDQFISLDERVQTSKQEACDAFVSLHYNTNADPNLSGTMTFSYNETGLDRELASRIQDQLVQHLGLPDHGTRFGDYYVLRENPQPAVLIETAFLTNQRDEQKAKDPQFQDAAAEAIFQALVETLK